MYPPGRHDVHRHSDDEDDEAAGIDHQSLAAMTGMPIRTQAPAARASMPRALLSANEAATRMRPEIAPSVDMGLRLGGGSGVRCPNRVTHTCPVTVNGSLSGYLAEGYQPSASGYSTSCADTLHRGRITAPSGTLTGSVDRNTYLEKWNGSWWRTRGEQLWGALGGAPDLSTSGGRHVLVAGRGGPLPSLPGQLHAADAAPELVANSPRLKELKPGRLVPLGLRPALVG